MTIKTVPSKAVLAQASMIHQRTSKPTRHTSSLLSMKRAATAEREEGPTFADVPQQAISMSIKQIMKAGQILCIGPDARKAKAIKACFDRGVSPLAAASIVQRHPGATICLDNESAALISRVVVEAHNS